jgi:transposase
MKVSVEADRLKTLPCVGKVLSMVLMLEIGRVDRFPTAAHLARYAGWFHECIPAAATRVWGRCAGM